MADFSALTDTLTGILSVIIGFLDYLIANIDSIIQAIVIFGFLKIILPWLNAFLGGILPGGRKLG